MLVRPVSVWSELSGSTAYVQALLWQWLLLSAAEIIALPATIALSGAEQSTAGMALRILGILVGFLPLTILLNAAFAGLSWMFFRFIGITRSYREFLTWTAFGLLPFVLGALLGRVALELLQPVGLPQALLGSLQFRGISVGPSSWFPDQLPTLQFAWSFFNFADLFGIWSILLLALGLRHYLRAGRQESLLGSLCLLILCFVLLTGVWQLLLQLARST